MSPGMELAIRFQLFVERIRRDKRGQDLIEYALLIGFVAVAAGAVMPHFDDSLRQIFRRVRLVLRCALGRARACEALSNWGDDPD